MRDYKTFNGKRYVFLYYKYTKVEARRFAKEERARGWRIRVVKQRIGRSTYYDLYGRKAK